MTFEMFETETQGTNIKVVGVGVLAATLSTTWSPAEFRVLNLSVLILMRRRLRSLKPQALCRSEVQALVRGQNLRRGVRLPNRTGTELPMPFAVPIWSLLPRVWAVAQERGSPRCCRNCKGTRRTYSCSGHQTL